MVNAGEQLLPTWATYRVIDWLVGSRGVVGRFAFSCFMHNVAADLSIYRNTEKCVPWYVLYALYAPFWSPELKGAMSRPGAVKGGAKGAL